MWGSRIATSAIDGLKSQPLVLALIVMNLLFIIGYGYMLREIGQSAARRDALLQHCVMK